VSGWVVWSSLRVAGVSWWCGAAWPVTILFVARWIRVADSGQVALVPADMRDWLPEQHLAWNVLEAVRRLDLSGFYAVYRADGRGQAPYDPAMMLALVCYCYLKGITSTRTMRDACTDDVGCRVIGGGARPSNKAFAEFRRRHRDPVQGVFAQVLALLKAEGVIGDDDDVAAVDGSPVSTAASSYSALSAAQIDAEIARAGQRIEELSQAWAEENAAAAQEGLWRDDDGPGPAGPGGRGGRAGQGRKLAAAHRKLGQLRQARDAAARRAAAGPDGKAAEAVARDTARLEKAAARLAREEDAAEAKMARLGELTVAGRAWPYGKKPVPAGQSARVAAARRDAAAAAARLEASLGRAAALTPARVSATDPDSRVLPAKNGGWLQGFNVQASAGRSQVLYAIATHDSPGDSGALPAMVAATDASCAAAGLDQLRRLLADCGYASAKTFTELAAHSSRLLVSVRKEAITAGRRNGGRPVPAPWQDMAARFEDPAARKEYKKRGAYVEPFFAQFFQQFTRRIPFRGTTAVTAELQLRGLAHNLAKLFAHWNQNRNPARSPA
jgi:transposase